LIASSSFVLVSPALSANAAAATATTTATTTMTNEEKIIKGYNRLQHLLDNWEDETTVCKTGQETTFGDKCECNPTRVMEYLGYKSTSDPLFKAEATMRRLATTREGVLNSEREGEFYEAIDRYSRNAEEYIGSRALM
jgi:hypothetical protein